MQGRKTAKGSKNRIENGSHHHIMTDMQIYRKQVKLVFWLPFFTAARYTYQARAALVIGAQLRLENPFVYF
jgi:hypothetical protein